ncbi:MAG: BrnT family toxin [Hypericibacter sp.]
MADSFEWDDGKRWQNLSEHGVDFADAALIFEGEILEAVDDRGDYGEVRYRALGRVDADHFMIVYTWRGENRRIISAWRVNQHGRQRYEAILARRVAGDAEPG